MAKVIASKPVSSGQIRWVTGLLVLAAVLALLGAHWPRSLTSAAARSTATMFDVGNDDAERAALDTPRATVKVARAPVLERLGVEWPARLLIVRNFARTEAETLCDRRRELRRVQIRRRVPRMNSEEPPWT